MAFVGFIIGGVIAMYLGGSLAAWVIRKASKATKVQSYILAVPLMTFVGAWAITYDEGPAFLENWALYVICAAIVLPLMIARERRNQRPRLENKAG